jgi:hypothetical protein
MVNQKLCGKDYHHIHNRNYLEVEYRDNGWIHTRIVYSNSVFNSYEISEGTDQFSPIYNGLYACPEEDLPGVLKKAREGYYGLWGADEDY